MGKKVKYNYDSNLEMQILRESWFYKHFVNNFSVIGFLSQFIYILAFTSLLSLVISFWKVGILFKESSIIITFIFFMVLFLFIEKLDVIVSRNYGLGSIANYSYLFFWIIGLFNNIHFMIPGVYRLMFLLLSIGFYTKYIVPQLLKLRGIILNGRRNSQRK